MMRIREVRLPIAVRFQRNYDLSVHHPVMGSKNSKCYLIHKD